MINLIDEKFIYSSLNQAQEKSAKSTIRETCTADGGTVETVTNLSRIKHAE